MGLSYDDLMFGPGAENNQILIVSDKWTVKGFLTEDIRIDGRSHWNESHDPKYQELANKYLNAGSTFWNQLTSGLGMSNMTMKSRQVKSSATLMVNWEGSENFRITLPLIFVATSSNDDVRIPVRALYDTIYPVFGEFGRETLGVVAGEAAGSILDNFVTVMVAPMGYERGNYSKPQGVMRLLIGKWFKSTSIFVVDDINFSFSKQSSPAGLPLYASGSLTMSSCRPISSTEIKQWMSSGAIPTPKYLSAGTQNEYPAWGDSLNSESRAGMPDTEGSEGGNVRFFETPQASTGVY